jgi:sialate O-acetylesterase
MKRIMPLLLLLWIALIPAKTNIILPRLFSDNMVLQREMRVPVWGRADAGEKVMVELGGHQAETTTGPDGKWKLYLGPLDAGGPFEMKITGKNVVVLKNILVGEVWVCSGQSNMAMEVENCLNARQEMAVANYPMIRQFQVKRAKSLQPLEDVSPADNPKADWLNTWEVCDSTTIRHFTGVGYFFGFNLYLKLKVPIGLIHASWGGTTAEAWTPKDTLENDPDLRIILSNWPDYNNDEDWLKQEYAGYLKEVEKAVKKGSEKPLYFNCPTVLYNGIIAPVIPYGIRGVTWYQGESNAYRAYQYRTLFPAMIKQWRKKWDQGNFPFLFVQLANYHFEPQVFPELREAQFMALSLPNTAMAVAIDVGDSADIHPKNKQEVGRRLSLAARKLAYGEDITFSGPLYKSMVVNNGRCILSFTSSGEKLLSKNPEKLTGFAIAGTNRKFLPAQAKIEGNEVVVWNSDIPQPVAVRYAWANHPGGCNLYNTSTTGGILPASPFRTDDWPGITGNRR